jgi:hypothetical protein
LGIADNSTDTAMTIHSSGDITLASTGSIIVPVGTTAQRPADTAGSLRYNSTTGEFEGYTTEWGSIGGSIDATHGSLTPTATSPSNNTIVISNYASYSNPSFSLFIGTTPIPFEIEGSTFTITGFTLTGSQTVTIRGAHGGGSIFTTLGSVTVNIVDPAARYWRLIDFIQPYAAYPVRMGYLKMWTGLNGTGTAPASASDSYYTANMWGPSYPSYQSSYGPHKARTLPFGGQYTTWSLPYNGITSTGYIQLDMQSPVVINSIDFAWTDNTSYYHSPRFTLEKSTDGTNWTQIAPFGVQTGGTVPITGSDQTLLDGRNNVAQLNRTDQWVL